MSSPDTGLQVNKGQWLGKLPGILRILGVAVIIAGIQSYGFYVFYVPRVNAANQELDHLIDEVATNKFVNSVLNDLGDLRRNSQDEGYRKEIVQVYERFIKEFLEDPRVAIEEFARITSGFNPPEGALGKESLATLRSGVESLQALYSDHYQEIIDDLNSPPLYLQPTASLIRNNNVLERNVRFNRGVYLSLVGDRSPANTIFNDLKNSDIDNRFRSVVNYAQARLLYDAFQSEGQFDYFQQAIQTLKESLRNDPEYGQPKLFLEYLLSLDKGSQEVNAPVTGDGTGEAEGERGVISSAPPNF
jgi:tetratricopeptide (TPR) repeat protein